MRINITSNELSKNCNIFFLSKYPPWYLGDNK
jgi:hypothetical protein